MKNIAIIVLLFSLFFCYSCQRRASRHYGNRPTLDNTILPNGQNLQNEPFVVGQTTQNRVRTNSAKRVLSGQEIFKRYSAAVFMVYTSTGRRTFQGSGFFVSSDGLAVSNYHVFEGTNIGYERIVLSDGSLLKLGEVVIKDKDNDLMLFRVASNNKKFVYIPISHRQINVGEKVFAIGSPQGLENTFSSGEISQLRGNNIIQINVPIDHGSSGGALMNEYGEVIGVTSGGYETSGANLNFAISIDPIRKYLGR